ncbi:MAG: PEGA domain-containing protein, partial [candidate division Zixibacteria bacterium]|nr:PEGA domain-containing protein [candidate division Zixibacteria bacterium]
MLFLKRLIAIVVLFLLPFGLMAQEQPQGFRVESSPPGAEVSLRGNFTINGITPVNFTQGLDGHYAIVVQKHGYETYRSSIYLQSERGMSLTVRLRSKTRLKAFVRSMIIPGWGQSYTDQSLKGKCFTLLAAGAVASYLIADSRFNDRNNEYKATRTRYNSAKNFDEKVYLYSHLQNAKKKAYDAENVRRITIGATIAVWGLNLIDLLF